MGLVKLSIKGISYSHTQNGAYALILNEEDGERQLPIVIGAFEAQSIAIAIEKDIKPPRPLTHDLFKNFADRFKIKISKVIIHKLVDGVFFSSIICERNGVEEIIDARTSDAIALAIRFFAPVYTYKKILDKAGIIISTSSLEESQTESVPKISHDTQITKDDFSEYSLSELYNLLEEAVQNEDYEKAVILRDEISKRKI